MVIASSCASSPQALANLVSPVRAELKAKGCNFEKLSMAL